LLKCHEVDWKRIKRIAKTDFRAVYEVIEFSKLVYIVPNTSVVGVKYVGAINVYDYAILFFGITISGNMLALFDN